MTVDLASVDRFIELNELELAQAALDGAGCASPARQWQLALRRQWLQLETTDSVVDESVLALEQLLQNAPADVPRADALLAHALLAQAYARKRCRALAGEVLDRATAELGAAAVLEVERGNLLLAFDDREEAARCFERAEQMEPNRSDTTYRRANLAYIEGRFADAEQLVDQVPRESGCRRAALRLRAALAAATQNHSAEANAWRTLLDEADAPTTGDQLSYGLALAAADDLQGAADQFEQVWRADPDAPHGRYARQRLEYLQAAGETDKRRRLAAFPTTYQKRNYCGPAVLELCLRYLDFDLTQDEIAQVVRKDEGTPMYAIVDYLAEHGIVSRRIEATPDRIRAAIDLGLPVIIQEEYSTTSHVAVVTGYDARLGVFLANDPATHRPLIKPFRWVEYAGDLFGNGGVIVLGRTGAGLDELNERLDAAGLVAAPHLSLLDDCDRAPRVPEGDEKGGLAPQDIIRRCNQALEMQSDFRLAWYRRAWETLRWWDDTGRDDDREQLVLSQLLRSRARYPELEWPHQVQASYLRRIGRYEEAFLAYFEAFRRDNEDANNLANMGACKWWAGDLVAAERHLLRALACDPSHPGAAHQLAAVYLRQLEEDDEELPDLFAHVRIADPEELHTSLDREAADILRRGLHFARVAVSVTPDDGVALAIRGALQVWAGQLEAARDDFEAAHETGASMGWFELGRAATLEALDDAEHAGEVLHKASEEYWESVPVWECLADHLVRRDQRDEAVEALTRGIAQARGDKEQLARKFFAIVSEDSSAEAAATRLRGLAQDNRGDFGLVRDCAWLLDSEHQRGHAIALFRHVVGEAPNDVSSSFQLAAKLVDNLSTREEGLALLDRVVHMSPEHPVPRRLYAAVLAESDPGQGLSVLEPVLENEDAYVWAVQADLLERLGRHDESHSALERALAYGGDPVKARAEIVQWHIRRNQYERAVDLARELPLDHDDEETRVEIQDAWLSAYRLAGRQDEILDTVRELCRDGVPKHLGFDVYYAYRASDHELAAAGAEAAIEQFDGEDAASWRIKAIGCLAQAGKTESLDRAAEIAGEDAEACADLVYVYDDLRRLADAQAAAEHALAVDPNDKHVLSAVEHIHGRTGQLDQQLQTAHRLLELFPYEHQGPERLGWLLAKRGDIPAGLEYSEQAVDAAPYCHLAHTSRAVALFMAGDLDGALVHARQSERLEPSVDDPGADALLVVHALAGDREALATALAARRDPPHVFPEFDQRLQEVVAVRAAEREG